MASRAIHGIQGAVPVPVQAPEGGALLLRLLVGRHVAFPELGQRELPVPVQVLNGVVGKRLEKVWSWEG